MSRDLLVRNAPGILRIAAFLTVKGHFCSIKVIHSLSTEDFQVGNSAFWLQPAIALHVISSTARLIAAIMTLARETLSPH